MAEHPIQGLMQTAMENIKEMIDVNTIVGDPVQTPDGSVIMPISKLGLGFVAGGSDIRMDMSGYAGSAGNTSSATAGAAGMPGTASSATHPALPFGGGSGGGVSITPIAFLVVGTEGVKVVPLDNQTHLIERVIDAAPRVVDRLQSMFSKTDQAYEPAETLV